MISRMIRLLAPPVFSSNREKTRNARVLNTILLVTLLDFSFDTVLRLLDGSTQGMALAIDMAVLLFACLFLYLLHRGEVEFVGNISILIGFFVVTLQIYTAGTILTDATMNFIFVIIVAGMLFQWIGTVISISASSLALLVLFLAQNAGLLPPPTDAITLRTWLLYTIGFVVIGGLNFYTGQVTQKALKSAEKEISERERAEIALKKANETLQRRMEEIKQLQAELREQSLRDPLTGLYNRRYLAETLAREIARARRKNEPLSVIISDVDNFKKINDTYGHHVGDQFLVEIAKVFMKNSRSSDIVCRYGGEEFLLVILGASLQDAVKRAEEMRQKSAGVILWHKGQELRITMSFGVSTYPIHGTDGEEIIIKADKALYQSKYSGRDLVTFWQENEFDTSIVR